LGAQTIDAKLRRSDTPPQFGRPPLRADVKSTDVPKRVPTSVVNTAAGNETPKKCRGRDPSGHLGAMRS